MVRKTQTIIRRSGRLAIELIARYQPLATDLRFIRSCMEIAYSFFRFGRYSYDIVDVLESMGSVAECDKSAVFGNGNHNKRDGTIKCKITSARDRDAAGRLYELDDKVDALYRKYLNEAISTPTIYKSKNKLQNHDVIFLSY